MQSSMNVLRYMCLGGVLGVFLLVTFLIPSISGDPVANPNPDPGKVVFKSAHTNYEYEVGKQGNYTHNNNFNKGGDRSLFNDNAGQIGTPCVNRDENRHNNDENDYFRPKQTTKNGIPASNIYTTTTASTATATTFKPRLIYPGFTGQNATEPPSAMTKGIDYRKRRRNDEFKYNYESQGEESRRISIAIRPQAAASENTDVVVKVRKSITTSAESNDEREQTNSKSNEVVDETEEVDELEKRKRDCRGLPWPFVNALNATNCLNLDDEDDDFSPRMISLETREELDEDEDDATIILPKRSKNQKKRRGGRRKKLRRDEDYDDEYPLDPFHRQLPQARSYHEYAMMLREMAPSDDGFPRPFQGGPTTYGDWQSRSPYEGQQNQGWGWGWSTTTPAPKGWGWTTTTASTTTEEYGSGLRQGHELKPSFGQPSQLQQGPGGQTASFGKPSNPQQQQPAPVQQPASFGQPGQNQTAPAPQQQTAGDRQGKALQFGQPSQQQVQIPAPAPQNIAQPPAQQRSGYLAPAYYSPPSTPTPYSNNGGWSESTTKQNGWGWTTTTTTQQPEYKQPPPYGLQQQPVIQPSPTIYPILQVSNQTAAAPAPIQQQPQAVQPMNRTQVMELYNRLLGLYKILINDTTSGQQPPQQRGPPPYQQPNPWQVPPPQQRGFDGFYPGEMMPGIADPDPYMYDPFEQPKLLPRPISPVGRRRQARRRQSRRMRDQDDNTEESEFEPRVSFISNEPTVLHEISNNEEFLPRKRYFKRKIDDKDLTNASDKKKKKKGRRRWGSPSTDDDFDYDDMEGFPKRYRQPQVPPYLRYDPYEYRPPVYGPPPPPESSGGWGTPPPPSNGWTETTTQGWGWPETTTQQPGWGWTTTTTAKPGWGWQESTTTTTTTTQAPPPSDENEQQQTTAGPTEDGPSPGQQWSPPSESREYLQQQFLQLQQQLLEQLQASGKLPPQYQQQMPQRQQQQGQQQYPILQPNFGTQGQQPQPQYVQQPSPTPQQIQQQNPSPQQIQQISSTAPVLDPVVIEDIGRTDSPGANQLPAFRGQAQPINSQGRQAAARQLFNGEEVGRSIVSTVTSTSVSESANSEELGRSSTESSTGTGANANINNANNQGSLSASAIQVQPGAVQQVSSNNTTSSSSLASVATSNNVYSSNSIPAVRQLRYSPSSTGEPQVRGVPSWGSWGGSYSPTYSKVQNAQPQSYRILKRFSEGERGTAMGLIETQLGQAKKIEGVDGNEENRPSLLRKVVD